MHTPQHPAPTGPFAEIIDRTEELRIRAAATVYRAHLVHIGHLVQRVYPAASVLHVTVDTDGTNRAVTLDRVLSVKHVELWSATRRRDESLDLATVRQAETELRSAVGGEDLRLYWRERDAAGTFHVDLPHPEDVRLVEEKVRPSAVHNIELIVGDTRLAWRGSPKLPAMQTAGVITSHRIDPATGRLVIDINSLDAKPSLTVPGTSWVGLEIVVDDRVEFVSTDELPLRPYTEVPDEL